MARLLDCRDLDFDCDYICAETDQELLSRAYQYVKGEQRSAEVPGELEDRVRELSQTVTNC
jgi:hypothetical protein